MSPRPDADEALASRATVERPAAPLQPARPRLVASLLSVRNCEFVGTDFTTALGCSECPPKAQLILENCVAVGGHNGVSFQRGAERGEQCDLSIRLARNTLAQHMAVSHRFDGLSELSGPKAGIKPYRLEVTAGPRVVAAVERHGARAVRGAWHGAGGGVPMVCVARRAAPRARGGGAEHVGWDGRSAGGGERRGARRAGACAEPWPNCGARRACGQVRSST